MSNLGKIPVIIDAWQFTKENFKDGAPAEFKDESIVLWSQYGGRVIEGEIRTIEGKTMVSENDWILRSVNGEFYICKPDIFRKHTKRSGFLWKI